MEIIYLLVPLAAVLAVLIVWGLLWAIRSGQFDDLERPAHEILWDAAEGVERAPSAVAPPLARKPPVSPTVETQGRKACANVCARCDRDETENL